MSQPTFMQFAAALIALALPSCASAQEIEEVSPGLFRKWEKLPRNWALLHYARDKAIKNVFYCDLIELTGSEIGFHVAFDKATRARSFGFMGDGTATLTAPVKIAYWFDDGKAAAQTVEAKNVKAPDGMEWLTASTSVSEAAIEDRLLAHKKIAFSYPLKGKTRTQSFPLAGTDAAVKKFAACTGN